MATSIFDKTRKQFLSQDIVARTDQSRDWFLKNLRNINVSPNRILKDTTLIAKSSAMPGRMMQFVYDPKGKDTLPYYDKFPLVLVVGPAPDGFYGLNLHYLQPLLRVRLFDKLMEYANNDKYDESTKLRISYQILNSVRTLKEFKPCFKHYLTKHVESRLMMIPSENWEIAVFLPTEKFKKATAKQVWSDSKRSIR